MSNISNTPNPFDRSDPQKFSISPVEESKKNSILIEYKKLKICSSKMLYSYLFQLLHNKTLSLLNSAKKKSGLTEKALIEAIISLKKQIVTLKQKDLSKEVSFSITLSNNWHVLLRASNELSHYKNKPSYFEALKLFIEELMNYPAKAVHSLGYYLTEYTGEPWIPFPYMDLLRSLHEDAIIYDEKSTLQKWFTQLSTLQSSLLR